MEPIRLSRYVRRGVATGEALANRPPRPTLDQECPKEVHSQADQELSIIWSARSLQQHLISVFTRGTLSSISRCCSLSLAPKSSRAPTRRKSRRFFQRISRGKISGHQQPKRSSEKITAHELERPSTRTGRVLL